jgi:hypothetical protein
MKSSINVYRGMNQDAAYDSIKQEFYIYALDMRVTTTKGESQGAITNVKGNKHYFDIPTKNGVYNGEAIIGVANIRNTIILFVADNTDSNGYIYTLTYDETDKTFTAITQIYYDADLGFSKSNPIEAVGRFESGNIQRVYWTDYNNYLRAINIADPLVNTLPPELIDIFPNVIYTQPLLTSVQSGGALLVGQYQYAFRLFTSDGKQTLISPPGALIHTTSTSETISNVRRYSGNAEQSQQAVGVNTGKAHEITIDVSNYSDFDKIELISIYHTSLSGTPEVTSVETKAIGGGSTVSFLHTGNENTITDLTLDEYTFKQYTFKTCKSLVPKDNSLVVANIKEGTFEIAELLDDGDTFDARTGRYDSGGLLPHPLTGTAEEIDDKRLKNAFNTEVDSVAYPALTKPTLGYNKDAHWDAEWHTDKQFKYKANGTTLGGEGLNISYNFYLEKHKIDAGSNVEYQNINVASGPLTAPVLNDGYTYSNTFFPNLASPYLSGVIRGYKRGEVYRFGIVFYNKKGEASFVEYIGDIKFPDISDEDDSNNNSGTPNFPIANTTDDANTFGYALGIEFDLDFSTCPSLLENITGYQIVRVDRTDENIQRLCSGIMKVAHKPDLNNPPGLTGEYDLRPDGTEDTVHLMPFNKNYTTAGAPYTPDNTLPSLGFNGNFSTINNTSIQGIPFEVLGAFLTFYSPEISYDFSTVTANTGASSYLLITGRYSDYYSIANGALLSFGDQPAGTDAGYIYNDLSTAVTEALGTDVNDVRRKLRNTLTVNKVTAIGTYATYERGTEYIKKWRQNARVTFNENEQLDSVLASQLSESIGKYNGYRDNGTEVDYYFRNFYAYLGKNGDDLNNHLYVSPAEYPTIWTKGATGLTGTIENISSDPLLQTSMTPTAPYYFDTGQFPTNYDATSTEGPVACPTFTDGLRSTPILDILLPKSEIYGGFGEDSLAANTFIPASPFIQKPSVGLTDSLITMGGDIFVDMWTFQESSAYLEQIFYQNAVGPGQEFTDNFTSHITLPIESRINLSLAYGCTFQRGVRKIVNGGASGVLHEKWRQETDNTETDYGKALRMYEDVYGEVYSRGNKDLSFFIKPVNFSQASNVNDIRAFISNVKANNESIDSWTQFGYNNFYDVDDYGPINKVVNFRDEVFFVQDKAIGRYSINPRAIVSTQDGIPTELGSGEGFQDHVYLSTEHGAIHQWAVEVTDTGIYYYDGIHKKIFMAGESNQPISELKGIHSTLANMAGPIFTRKENGGDNPILNKGVHVTRDKQNDEVLFTFLGNTADGTGKETLVYDELAQEFTSFYSATPTIYIENGDLLITPDPDNPEKLYQHHEGNWGEFYGTVNESQLKLVLNPEADINKILRFIEFNSIVRDDNKVIDRTGTQTITGFRVETEYQDTGIQNFDTGRIKRRFDKWRLKIPRNSLSSKEDRIRSTHFILTLYYDNSFNKELILNRIVTHFDIQIY